MAIKTSASARIMIGTTVERGNLDPAIIPIGTLFYETGGSLLYILSTTGAWVKIVS